MGKRKVGKHKQLTFKFLNYVFIYQKVRKVHLSNGDGFITYFSRCFILYWKGIFLADYDIFVGKHCLGKFSKTSKINLDI
jgi:hypothetical protein